MTRGRGVLRAVSVAGLALAGLVGGHAIGYAIAIPDAHHRSTLVAETGHGYLPAASWIAIVFGLAALGAGIVRGYVRRTHRRRERFGRAALAMMGMQALAFVLVEVFERLAAGAPLDTLSPYLLLVGIAAQLVVGLVAALVLVGLRKLGSALRAQDFTPAAVPIECSRAPEAIEAHPTPALSANHVRGPPAAAA